MHSSLCHRDWAVIFDWDGTLYDSEYLIDMAVCKALKRLSLPLVPAVAKSLYRPGRGDHWIEHVCETVVPDQRSALRAQVAIEFVKLERAAKLKTGARDLLWQLRQRGVAICIATGRDRQRLGRDLSKLALSDWFALTVCGDDEHSKQRQDCVSEILDKLRVLPHRCAFVGDSDEDAICAAAGGVRFFCASFGHRGQGAFSSRHAPAPVAATPLELLQLLEAWMSDHATT